MEAIGKETLFTGKKELVVSTTERMRRMRIEKESWKSCNIRLLNVVGGGWRKSSISHISIGPVNQRQRAPSISLSHLVHKPEVDLT